MKQFLTLLLLFTATNLCQAQGKHPIQWWVYGTAGHYFPAVQNSSLRYTHEGWNAGLGAYGAIPLWAGFSVQAGLGYRYLFNGQTYYTYSTDATGTVGSDPSYDEAISTDFREYSKHYLTLPLKLRYTTKSKLFVESGVEAAWLLNYKYRTAKTEFNWLLGAGIALGPMDCSVQYVKALDPQSIGGKVAGGPWEQEDFKNRMFNIQIAYPLSRAK
ncbi:hypothetical protein [Gaoshiqia sp. Z1-71]|uniref:hypothetical protein n=1 Tax=Gaoshiqia hydrogeniformans TaxID=3290090 RepID=UPI003BF7FB55